MPELPDPNSDARWADATFEGARRANARHGAKSLTAWERIQWACAMSEAIRLRESASESGAEHGADRLRGE